MYNYSFTEAANVMISDLDFKEIQTVRKYRSKYDCLLQILMDVGIVYRGSYTNGRYVKENVILLDDDFIRNYPEAKIYFDEILVNNKWYQLKITDTGVKNLFEFIRKVLEKELF